MSHQGKANQHYNETALHTHQDACDPKDRITSIGVDIEKLESSYFAGGNLKWYNHFEKQPVSSSKS